MEGFWENIEAIKNRVALLEANNRIAELEATRVPDELLEWLLSKAHYAGAWGDNYDQAEAILAKRKDGLDG